MTTKLDVNLFIRGASAEELEEIIGAIRGREAVLDGEASFKLPTNTRVWFDSGRRGIITGTITGWRRGGKADLVSDRGMKWTVPGRLLKKAQ